MSSELIERMAKAIYEAGQEQPYGLYDYSRYPGYILPHQVKDEKTGKVLFMSNDHDTAYEHWKKLSQAHVAKAALKAAREPTEKMLKAYADYGCLDIEAYRGMIDAELEE